MNDTTTTTDTQPYIDSWGNRYSTSDAPHSAPGDLAHAPRTTARYPRAAIAWMADNMFVLPVEKLTKGDRYTLTRYAFIKTGRPINPAVLALPHEEMVKTFTDYSHRIAGRYTDVEVTTTAYPDGARISYNTTTAGGGGYTPERVHIVTRDELKAIADKWDK